MRSIVPSLAALLAATIFAVSSPAKAEIVQEVIRVQVTAKDRFGKAVTSFIPVTVHHEKTRARSPILVLNHGRDPKPEGRHVWARYVLQETSENFVGLGYTVFVPTRLGYGIENTPDVEDAGACEGRRYEPIYQTGLDQTWAVVDYAATRADVDPSTVVIVGQSFGGTIAAGAASTARPAVKATINFAGGGGGNPDGRTGRPCSGDALMKLFKGYGATARIPSLWLYSINDEYWGPDLPKAWFKAHQEAGGKALFISLPAVAGGGHGSMTKQPDAWHGAVVDYLRKQRLPAGAP